MQLSGAYTFNAPVAEVWTALTDAKALSNCIPGCESMEATGENQYKATVRFALGPISGRYNATISMSEMCPNRSFRLSIQANGPMGFADGHADITLEATEEDTERDTNRDTNRDTREDTQVKTRVTVDAESQVGGAAARVGQRLMGSVAKTTMDRFFSCLKEQVE